MTWANDIISGINNTLEIEKNNFILHIENMDTKRHNSKSYYKSLASLYKSKYQDIKFDLILASDNNAFDFLKEYRDDIFGVVPVSFSGINNYSESMIAGEDKYTGVEEITSEKETVELILKLHPKTKNIYILNDYLTTGRAWQKSFEKNLKPFSKRVNLIYNKNETLENIQKKIKNLSSDTVLLMGVYFTDKNNQYLTYEKMGNYLLDISPVPVYTLTNFTISDGVIGGKVLSGYEHGKMMAKLGLSILQGADANKIDVVKEGTNKFIFNQLALDKFNINLELLPKEHKVINKSISIIEKYIAIISTFMIVAFLALVIIIFVFYKRGITKEKSILKLIVYGPIIFMPIIISILTYTIIDSNEEIHQNDLRKLKSANLKEQKVSTTNKVETVAKYIYNLNTKEEVLEYINNYRYGHSGYFFALNKDGVMLAHGSNANLINTNMNDSIDDNGVRFIQNIIHNAMINSFDLTEYLWINPQTQQSETKYSYSKYIAKHDLIIGSGVYIEDIKNIVNEKTLILNERNRIQIRNIMTISFILIILSTIVSFILSNIIKKIFIEYNHQIDDKNRHLEKLNHSLEDKIKEEVQKSRDKDTLIFQQSKMAAMGDMIGNIAHQWRQPLSIISTAATGTVAKIEYDMIDNNEIIKNCNTINENAQYLSQTIEDFKNYIQNDREKIEFNLKNNIDNLLTLVNASLKTYQINIILDLDEDISLHGYPNELIQCMMNILNNAKDALLNISDEKYIFITAKEEGDKIKIIFKDNANGVPNEIISKIFEPYFTTKHKSQGTGLGLSMTYNIITQGMSGSIEVKNTDYTYKDKRHTGAMFIITLPCC